ncbi:C40 family peptidase [Actinomadura keratinilytica]|uniref:C40 family peptidase n=1 Tax=Actinomadura keratinilytica TaxID=547461 RepID=UPI00362136F6
MAPALRAHPPGQALRQGGQHAQPEGTGRDAGRAAALGAAAPGADAGQVAAPRRPRGQLRAAPAGAPLRGGGTGRRGFDCSGLVQRAWRRAGVRIPRVAASQYHNINPKIRRRDLLPGDLVFFNRLNHVGMYVGGGRFVHSPRPGRRVTVERLRGHYRSRYVGAVRPAWRRLPPVPTRLY